MTVTAFDTLKLARMLRDKAGMTPEQAEGTAEALGDAFKDNLATKHDIEMLRRDLKDTEQSITIKLGALIVALGGFLAAIRFFGV